MAGYGMKKMAEGGMTGRPKTMAAAMKKVEKSAADRRLDKMAGVKEGSAKDIRADKMLGKTLMAGKPLDIRADKMQAKNLMGNPQVSAGAKAAYSRHITDKMQANRPNASKPPVNGFLKPQAAYGVGKMSKGGVTKRGK